MTTCEFEDIVCGKRLGDVVDDGEVLVVGCVKRGEMWEGTCVETMSDRFCALEKEVCGCVVEVCGGVGEKEAVEVVGMLPVDEKDSVGEGGDYVGVEKTGETVA